MCAATAAGVLERPIQRLIQSRMPLRGTSKDENRGRSPVEPGNVTGAVSPSFSLAPGPLGTNNCRREHGNCSGRCGDPNVAAGEFGEDVEGPAAVLGRG